MGLTVVVGLGFLAWAGVQLKRTILTRRLGTPWRAYEAEQTANGDDGAMPTGRAVYWAFYHTVLIVWTMLHVAVVYAVVKLAAVHVTPEGMAFAAVVIPTAAYLDLEILARCLGWDEGPVLDWRQRVTWIAAGGMGVALIATGTAATLSAGRYERGLDEQKQAAAERQKRTDFYSSPDMKAANEAIRRQNDIRREAAEAGKPLTNAQVLQQYVREERAKRSAATRAGTP